MGRVTGLPDLLAACTGLRGTGKRVVFTNGVFDILHRGHVDYLAAARALGDALVVGVNGDASVRRIKGAGKPIVPQDDRAALLAALACVDFVTLFDDDTPAALVAALLPDVLVKGGDYAHADIVGREDVERAGGRVVTIPLTPDRSSSNIVRTILERYCP